MKACWNCLFVTQFPVCDECADGTAVTTPSPVLSPPAPSACWPNRQPGLCGSVDISGGSTCSPPPWPGLRPASPAAEPAPPLSDRVRLTTQALGEHWGRSANQIVAGRPNRCFVFCFFASATDLISVLWRFLLCGSSVTPRERLSSS